MNELKNLLPKTEKIIKQLAEAEFLADFTFVGGSALAQYLQHRYSEDIDLFTWNEKIDFNKINEKIQSLGFEDYRIINLTENQVDYFIEGVKITFFANGWNELKKRRRLLKNLYIADIEVLAVMKVNTLFFFAGKI